MTHLLNYSIMMSIWTLILGIEKLPYYKEGVFFNAKELNFLYSSYFCTLLFTVHNHDSAHIKHETWPSTICPTAHSIVETKCRVYKELISQQWY